MKKLYTFLILLFTFTFAQAQNDIKARIEFEEAEKAYTEENYETALKHLNQTEKELGRWTPNVSYLKIECLYALTDMGNFGAPTMQPLYEEVTKYMAHLNKLKSNDVPMEKYKDNDKAKEWYLKAIENNNGEAAEGLAKIDKDNARKYYEQSAQLEHPYVVYAMGWYAENVDNNPTMAMEFYQQAVNLGSTQAILAIADLYKEGKGVTADAKKAEKHYKSAAIKGSSDALFNIGSLYHNGENGIVQNHKTAIEWYMKAVEKANHSAMYNIGWIYQNGQGGFPKDYKKAEEWYLKSAEVGSSTKYEYKLLGELYSLSDNNQPLKALEYYEKYAEAGYAKGMLETANIYFIGKGGVAKDYAKAAKYYEQYYENEKKNENFIDNLIDIYNRGGYGVEKDKEKAKYWKEIRRR